MREGRVNAFEVGQLVSHEVTFCGDCVSAELLHTQTCVLHGIVCCDCAGNTASALLLENGDYDAYSVLRRAAAVHVAALHELRG